MKLKLDVPPHLELSLLAQRGKSWSAEVKYPDDALCKFGMPLGNVRGTSRANDPQDAIDIAVLACEERKESVVTHRSKESGVIDIDNLLKDLEI